MCQQMCPTYVLNTVDKMKRMNAKYGSHSCAGRKRCATPMEMGDVTHVTRIRKPKLALIAALIRSALRAPLMYAIEVK